MNTHTTRVRNWREKNGKQSAKAASWGVNGKENNLTHSMKGMKTRRRIKETFSNISQDRDTNTHTLTRRHTDSYTDTYTYMNT